MLYAIISDVHANLEALGEVLKDIKRRNIKQILFLGDAVGYGPNPNECVTLLKKNSKVLLAGNHDRAAVGLTSTKNFAPHARAAILWTASVLAEESKKTIKEFQTSKSLKRQDILLVHSSPWKPDEWHYLRSYEAAERSFRSFKHWICFIGHSHIPFILERLSSSEMLTCGEETELNKNSRYIINVGSVGQPRDGDPRACYTIITDAKVGLIRVEYPMKRTQQKMRKAGLPGSLIEGLSSRKKRQPFIST
jgi:predicted phosphodiesterase